jgi:hypothetical protein
MRIQQFKRKAALYQTLLICQHLFHGSIREGNATTPSKTTKADEYGMFNQIMRMTYGS